MTNFRSGPSDLKGRTGNGLKAGRKTPLPPATPGPPSPGTGVPGPTGLDWSAFDEEATSGDIIRYQLSDTITYPNCPEGYIWTHMRVAYETPTGIEIEQVPFGILPPIERRVRGKGANQISSIWLQFGSEEARLLRFRSQTGTIAVGNVITGATSGASATVQAINGDRLTVSRPTGGTENGLFLTDEPLQIGGVTVALGGDKIASHPPLDAAVHYSEWSQAKSISMTTGTPQVLVSVSTTTPLRDEGITIVLKPRGFNTLDPRNDLDFQSEITDVSEQGNLTYLPATLNHPTNRHIGYSDYHTLSFRGAGERSITHTIRNFDGSQTATATTTFQVGDPVTDGGFAEIWDVDESGLFTEGTAAGSTTTTSFDTARNSAVNAASALIRIHGTVTSANSNFGNLTVQNIRIEGVGANAKLISASKLNFNSVTKSVVANLELDGLIDNTDPMSTPWPASGIAMVASENAHITRVKITGSETGLSFIGSDETKTLMVNDLYVHGSSNYGVQIGDSAVWINGLRVESYIDQPRGVVSGGNRSNLSVQPRFPPHGNVLRNSRPVGVASYQKCLMFPNMLWGGSYSAPGIATQPGFRFFGSLTGNRSAFYRVTYCTVQGGGFTVGPTSANSNTLAQDLIIDGFHHIAGENNFEQIKCDVGGTIVRNCVFTYPNVPQNNTNTSFRRSITLFNEALTNNIYGHLGNRKDEICVYNNTFAVLINATNWGRTGPLLSGPNNQPYDLQLNEALASVENNIFHRPNFDTPDIADAPLDDTTTFTSIYTGYLTWDPVNNVPGPRREDLAHQPIDTALWTPLTGSAALQGATTGRVAIRDLTGAFRHERMVARSASHPSRGAVEPPA